MLSVRDVLRLPCIPTISALSAPPPPSITQIFVRSNPIYVDDFIFDNISVSVIPGYGGDDCECFPGIAGALAGFAALGGLLAFALAQAIANNGGGRSFSDTVEPGKYVWLDGIC